MPQIPKQPPAPPVTSPTVATAPPGAIAGAVAPGALAGWNHFTRQLGVTLPTALRRAAVVRRSALRAFK